jgi:hypothetical protein
VSKPNPPTRKVQVSVALERAEFLRLQAEARAADRSLSSLIRVRLLQQACSSQEPPVVTPS